MNQFIDQLENSAEIVNDRLDELLSDSNASNSSDCPRVLIEAMRHGSLLGGKRLRPFLFMESARLIEPSGPDPLNAACAIELVHCYSLIHDDLPSMDDDDLRRGHPTVHKAFDEATAILAGDALLTLAFEILSDPKCHSNPNIRLKLIQGLARSCGVNGMVGGQILDLAAEKSKFSEEEIRQMQKMKTGALIRFACEGGAIFSSASADELMTMQNFGEKIGLAFQIADDLLDLVGDEKTVGKATGKDEMQGKATLVAKHGIEWARNALKELVAEAEAILAPFETNAKTLCQTAQFICTRDN